MVSTCKDLESAWGPDYVWDQDLLNTYLPPLVSVSLPLHRRVLGSCHLQTLSPALLQTQFLALPIPSMVPRKGESAQPWAHHPAAGVGVHGPQLACPLCPGFKSLARGVPGRVPRKLAERVLKSKSAVLTAEFRFLSKPQAGPAGNFLFCSLPRCPLTL